MGESILIGRLDPFRGRWLLPLLLATLVFLALAAFADIAKLSTTLAHFRWEFFFPALGLTLVNYFLRFVKWQLFLQRLGVRGLRRADSLAVFVGGFTMVLTPGKVGEFLKAFLLKQIHGIPLSRSAPIVVAERVSDGLAMALLGSLGLASTPLGLPLVASITGSSLALVIIVQRRSWMTALLRWGERLPWIARISDPLRMLYESAYQLFNWRTTLVAVAIGTVAWALEGLALYFIFLGLGLPPSATLLGQAIFILALSTIVGAISLLPGGLGAVEFGLTGLVLLLVSPERSLAVAAAVLIRLATLWLGTGLGMVALFLYRQRFFASAPTVSRKA